MAAGALDWYNESFFGVLASKVALGLGFAAKGRIHG
jgi:hypothetical protein